MAQTQDRLTDRLTDRLARSVRDRPMASYLDRALVLWYVLWCLAYRIHGGASWHFFIQGGRALGDLDDPVSGGVHLYAALPQLQIGPVALGVAWLFSPFGGPGSMIVAQLFGAVAGIAVLWLARDLARWARPDLSAGQLAWRLRLAALPFAPAWLYLAVTSAHLDDVLALLFGMLGLLAVTRQKALPAGLAFGLAVDAKPWALPFAVLLLMLTGNRARVIAVATLAAGVALAWLPFLLLDPHTLNALRFTIPNTSRTALRVLGVTSARTPAWDRPAQALLGLLLGAIALRRGRWPAVLLLVTAARVVLDPGTNMYYPAGVVLGAVLWDLAGSRSRLPWWTTSATLALLGARHLGLPPSANGWLTLTYFLACLWLLILGGIASADPIEPRARVKSGQKDRPNPAGATLRQGVVVLAVRVRPVMQ